MRDLENMAKSLNMRVGQLIYNVTIEYDLVLYYVTDEELIQYCKLYCIQQKGA